MTTKIRIGVIYGGRSGEHEVSVRSARSVIEAVDSEKYEVIPIAITNEGRWLSPAESASLLPESAQRRLSNYAGVDSDGSTTLVDNEFLSLWFYPLPRILHHKIYKFLPSLPFLPSYATRMVT